MANTLTNMIPDAYAALAQVSREMVGFIPAVTRSATADRVAKDQTLRIPIAPANSSAGTFTPAMAFPDAAYQTIGHAPLTIDSYVYVPFSWTGEEVGSVNKGVGFAEIRQQQIAQAMRTAINTMESSIAQKVAQGASRAYGSAGTTPFGTAGDWTDAAQIRRILDDNGAPSTDRQLVLATAAGANLRAKQAQAYMLNDGNFLRQGVLFDVHGFALRESAQAYSHTAGTANATATINSAGYAVGATTLTLASEGTGTFTTGDVITHARDTSNKYVLKSGDADISNGGTVVLNGSGLRTAITTASSVITTTAAYTANCAFSRSAVLLATRLIEMPPEGDLSTANLVVTDPVSGITFEIRYYPGKGMGTYYLMLAYGSAVLQSDHIALLLG